MQDAFDIKAFHHAVLGTGTLHLEILENRIDAYVAEAGEN